MEERKEGGERAWEDGGRETRGRGKVAGELQRRGGETSI
jgi:hypothetical protein